MDNTYKKLIILCQNNFLIEFQTCKTNLKLLEQLVPSIFQNEHSLKTLIGHARVKKALLHIALKGLVGTMTVNTIM